MDYEKRKRLEQGQGGEATGKQRLLVVEGKKPRPKRWPILEDETIRFLRTYGQKKR
jgi:hypothetical protein